MDENNLNETTGVGADPKTYPGTNAAFPAINKYGTVWTCPTTGKTVYDTVIDGPLNWDCDPNIVYSPKVRVDLSGDGVKGMLQSYNDWPVLKYAGGAVGGNGAAIGGLQNAGMEEFQEDQIENFTPPFRIRMAGIGILQAAPGTGVTLRYNVSNTGATVDTYALNVSSPLGWVNTTITPASLTLAPGTSQTVAVTFNVPAETAAGANDRIALGVKSQTSALIFDSFETLVYASSTPPSLALSRASVTFNRAALNSSGATAPLIITNTSASALTFASFNTTAQFSQTNNCGTTLAAGDTCVINLSFTPTAIGPQTGTLTITDSGRSSPETISLEGIADPAPLARSQISLTVTPLATITGRTVSFTATLAAASGKVPMGTVTFFNDTATLGMGTLDATGTATFSSAALPAGTYDVYAMYAGDTAFVPLTAPDQTLNITTAKPTTVMLSTSAATTTPGASVTFTATVTGGVTGSQPGGTVEFLDGMAVLGPGTLNGSAQATFTTSTLGMGPHSITAQYMGDSTFGGSTSAPLTETIAVATTSTTLTSSATTAAVGTAVVLTATVTSNVGTPAGTVTFLDAGSSIGTGTLNGSAVATLSISTLGIGTHTITAQYGAAGIFPGSVSSAKQVVITALPDFSIAGTPASLTITRGSTGSVAFTVTPLNGYSGTLKLSCGTLPAYASCSFTPVQLAFTAGAQTAQTSTLTFDTTSHSSALLMLPPHPASGFSLAAVFALPWLGLGLLGFRRRKEWKGIAPLTLLLTFAAFLGALSLSGCGSSAPAAPQLTPAGTYSVPVTVGTER